MQISQEAAQVVWYSYLFQNFPQFIVIHIVKGFGVVNKTKVDVFLELCCFFDDPIAVAGRNNNSLRYADDTTLMAESEEELKSLWMKVKVESEKVGLKLNIQKTKIMASGPITSWEIDGETVETVSDFIFWGSKITADGDCIQEIERHLLLGKLWPT